MVGRVLAMVAVALTAHTRLMAGGEAVAGSAVPPLVVERDAGTSTELNQRESEHWAFLPIGDSRPPSVGHEEWIRTPVDRFTRARMQAVRIAPARRADKVTLLRRATFDLHGLPPTRQEIRAFLVDDTPQAFARVVDRLLASPRYGEKWGRHWLDVARYADSTGLDDDIKLPHTWKYRDYVIDAFNRDTPYDRFIIEQLAGDRLPHDEPEAINERGLIATGFLAVGPKPLVQQDKVKLKYDVVDEQIDTMSKAFMALTMGCARCHDHKFDPLSTADYYSLAAIFASVRNFEDLDPSATVSRVYFAPLVHRSVYERYKEHQRQTRAVSQEIRSITELKMLEHIVTRRGPLTAEYMLTAYEIYGARADSKHVAADKPLESRIVEAWTKYLEPNGDLRLHLQEWHDAEASDRSAVAQRYEERYLARGREWVEKLRKWREAMRAWKGAGPSPGRPELDPAADRFFSEVTLDSGSMDEGASALSGPFAVPEDAQDALLDDASRREVEALRVRLKRLRREAPPEPPMAYAVAEGEPVEQHVFIRGNPATLGERVVKRFPLALAGEHQAPIPNGRGRLALARWLASPDHPLTSRVVVNRIWHWHFGDGLVRTPSNFGGTGEKPTHPALLDYLARQFTESGWSFKAMHRLIMLSSTYQMSSEVTEATWRKDPANHLWSRFNHRRLTVEELRDALLALDGSLDPIMGGTIVDNLDSYGFENAYLHPDKTRRRTVYLPVYRNKMPSMLTLFDFADSTASIGKRPHTNIAPQGLYFLNSEFVYARSRALADRSLTLDVPTDAERVEDAYWLALGRNARPEEVQAMFDYMAGYPVDEVGTEARVIRWQGLWRVLLSSSEFNYVN